MVATFIAHYKDLDLGNNFFLHEKIHTRSFNTWLFIK